MDSFIFTSSALSKSLEIRQCATKSIGFKVYPGGLVLCRYFEKNGLPGILRPILANQSHKNNSYDAPLVLEIGAGVCGLPGILLAHMGCNVVSTVRITISKFVERLI